MQDILTLPSFLSEDLPNLQSVCMGIESVHMVKILIVIIFDWLLEFSQF